MKKYPGVAALIKNNEILLVSGLVILIVIVLTSSLLIPNFYNANKIYSQTGELRTRLGKLNIKENQLSGIDANFFKETYPKMNVVLPGDKDYVSLFSTFDTLQEKTGVTIARTEFQFGVISTSSGNFARAPGTSAYVVPMSIEVKGNKSQIKRFIESLTDLSGRIMTVENVDWNFKSRQDVNTLISGLAYFYPRPLTIGSVESPLPLIDEKQSEIHKSISEKVVLFQEEDLPTDIQTGKKDLFH